MRQLVRVNEFAFNPELVKGWYIKESLGGLEGNAVAVRHCIVLYDCFQIEIEDNNRELEAYLYEHAFNCSESDEDESEKRIDLDNPDLSAPVFRRGSR